jgi:hypothetical protein
MPNKKHYFVCVCVCARLLKGMRSLNQLAACIYAGHFRTTCKKVQILGDKMYNLELFNMISHDLYIFLIFFNQISYF